MWLDVHVLVSIWEYESVVVCECECKRAALAAIKCPIMAIMELKFSIKIFAQFTTITQCEVILVKI